MTETPLPSSAATTPIWLRLHLLSLEAPLIAMAWMLGLAHLNRVPVMPGVLAGLGLCVWMIYVLDRLLDTRGKADSELDARHLFHRRHCGLLMAAVALGIAVVLHLAFWTVPADLMWHCVTLSVPMLFYLAIYAGQGSQLFFRGIMPVAGLAALSFIGMAPLKTGFKLCLMGLIVTLLVLMMMRRYQERVRSAMSKDVAGGVLFALGCTAWSRFIRDGSDPVGGFVEFVLLSCLFVSNLTGISTRRLHHGALAAGFGAVVGSLGLVARGSLAGSMTTLALCCAAGLGFLLVLDWRRKSMTEDVYRVLADVAVVLPVGFLLVR